MKTHFPVCISWEVLLAHQSVCRFDSGTYSSNALFLLQFTICGILATLVLLHYHRLKRKCHILTITVYWVLLLVPSQKISSLVRIHNVVFIRKHASFKCSKEIAHLTISLAQAKGLHLLVLLYIGCCCSYCVLMINLMTSEACNPYCSCQTVACIQSNLALTPPVLWDWHFHRRKRCIVKGTVSDMCMHIQLLCLVLNSLISLGRMKCTHHPRMQAAWDTHKFFSSIRYPSVLGRHRRHQDPRLVNFAEGNHKDNSSCSSGRPKNWGKIDLKDQEF